MPISTGKLVRDLTTRVADSLETADRNRDGSVSRSERSTLPDDIRPLAEGTANTYLRGGPLPVDAFVRAYENYAERAVGQADSNRDGVLSSREQDKLPKGVYNSIVAMLATEEPVTGGSLDNLYQELGQGGWNDDELKTFIGEVLDKGEAEHYRADIYKAVMNPSLPAESHDGERFFEAVAWYTDATVGGRKDGRLELPELQKSIQQQTQRYLQAYGDPQAGNTRLQAWKNIQKLRLLEGEIKDRSARGEGAYYPYDHMEMTSIHNHEGWNRLNTVDSRAEFQRDVLEASYDKPVLVKYGLPYCMHCLLLEKMGAVPAVDEKYDGEIGVKKLWWNPNDPSMAEITKVAQEEGVTSSPFFILYKDGEAVRSGYAFPDEKGEGLEDLLQGYVTQ